MPLWVGLVCTYHPAIQNFFMKRSMRDMIGLLNWLRSGPTDSNQQYATDRMTGAEKHHLAQFLKKESAAGRLKWYAPK